MYLDDWVIWASITWDYTDYLVVFIDVSNKIRKTQLRV